MEEKIISKDSVSVNSVLGEIETFGPFHYLQYLWIGLPVIFTSMTNANYIFTADDIDYRCRVPECELFGVSENGSFVPGWWPNVTDHQCSRPVFDPGFSEGIQQTCSVDVFSNMTESCKEWTYSSQNSIVAAFNLACKPWQRTLVGTVHNAGMLISMPLLGFVSDKFGRKTSLIVSTVGAGVLGTLKSFAPTYITYLVFEVMEAAFGAAAYTSTFVLLVELGGKKRTVLSAAYSGLCIALGEVILALIAQAYPYWKTLIRIIYAPMILFILYTILLSESFRWLLANGKKKQAKERIVKAARWNKVELSKETLAYLDKADESKELNIENQGGIQIKELFSSSIILQRLAISSFWWLSAAFIYYGLMINSVGLPGNKYANFMMSGAMSFPGDLAAMFTLNIFGRKKTLLFAYLFCGSCCIASGLVPETLSWLRLTVFLLGKMSIAACFNGIYIYSSELFPTRLRSSLVGCCSMFARVGCIIAPQTPLLVSIMPSLPSILFGGFALMAGILMLFTPETLGRELPDTVEQAEGLGSGRGKSQEQERPTGVYNVSFSENC